MWATISDNLTTGLAIVTASAGLVGAWLKLKPRRLIGWLSAVKERETLLAMLEHEKAWGIYWRTQAQLCIDQFQKEYQAEARADAEHESGYPAGGGRASSAGADGQNQRQRWTG